MFPPLPAWKLSTNFFPIPSPNVPSLPPLPFSSFWQFPGGYIDLPLATPWESLFGKTIFNILKVVTAAIFNILKIAPMTLFIG
jgi:hypothetical protein